MHPTSLPSGLSAARTPEDNLIRLQQATQGTQQPGMDSADEATPRQASVGGWDTPAHEGTPAQSPSASAYVYPDPEGYSGAGQSLSQIFYQSAAAVVLPRSGSAEP